MENSRELSEWQRVIETSDYPKDYWRTFSALYATMFALLFPSFFTEAFMQVLAWVIPEDPGTHSADKAKQWFLNELQPELIAATRNVKLPLADKLQILSYFVGIILKSIYTILFQLQFNTLPIFASPLVISLGGLGVPVINLLTGLFFNFRDYDASVFWSTGLYPGQ